MSSPPFGSEDGLLPDDRTAKARIRDAAIGCFAKHGVAGTTARKVADSAGMSPGSVIHHFGSMAGLRAACDEHVAAVVRQQKQEAMSSGTGIDVLAALRESNFGSLAGYLAEVLVEDSPAVAKLVDDLVADAEVYMQQGVEQGLVRPTPNPRGRAVVVAIWSLGALVLHRHLERILGVDVTDPDVGANPAIAAYVGPAYEIFGDGILTEEYAAHLQEAFTADVGAEESTESPATPTVAGVQPAHGANKGTV